MQKIGTIIKLRFGRTSYHQISFLFYWKIDHNLLIEFHWVFFIIPPGLHLILIQSLKFYNTKNQFIRNIFRWHHDIEKAIKRIKSSKAPGYYQITAEMLKADNRLSAQVFNLKRYLGGWIIPWRLVSRYPRFDNWRGIMESPSESVQQESSKNTTLYFFHVWVEFRPGRFCICHWSTSTHCGSSNNSRNFNLAPCLCWFLQTRYATLCYNWLLVGTGAQEDTNWTAQLN